MKRVKVVYILTMLFISGCIENDIPYPSIQANISEFEIVGQTSSVINIDERRVDVVLPETVYAKEAKIAKYMVEDMVESVPELEVGDIIDLSVPYSMVLSIYQDYEWIIIASQDVERKFAIVGQVGEPLFDATSFTAVAKVDNTQDISNIKITSLKLGLIGSTIAPSIAEITDFTTPQKVTVTFKDEVQEWTLSVISSAIVTSQPSEVWAKSATLLGAVSLKEGSIYGFEIKSDGGEFEKVDAALVVLEGSTLTADIMLEQTTNYTYRIFQDDKFGRDVSFTTPSVEVIPNMNMDDWYMLKSNIGKDKYWLPYTKGSTPYWITGNEGVSLFVDSNTVPTDDAVEGKAALMSTVKVPVVGLGAGSIYTGTFKTVLSNPLLSTKFGQPFTGRPRAVRGMYKYTQKVIDVSKDQEYIGTPDKGVAWIRLENWEGKTQLPSPDDYIKLGEGRLLFDKTISEYTAFEIPIEYTSKDIPTHISLCFSSSYLGDQFTGGIGSRLWIDSLEFVY